MGYFKASSIFAGLVTFIFGVAGYGFLHAILSGLGVTFLVNEIVGWTPILRRRWWK